jgi:hypothetical protein
MVSKRIIYDQGYLCHAGSILDLAEDAEDAEERQGGGPVSALVQFVPESVFVRLCQEYEPGEVEIIISETE